LVSCNPICQSFLSVALPLSSLLRKTKATCFLSYVECRPNTNTSNIMKKSLHQGEVTTGRGRIKEGS
jgi:hypothetical protein